MKSGSTVKPPEFQLPRWVPWVLFVGLTVLLFKSFIFSDLMLFGSDTMALGYQARRFFANALTEAGTFPLWNPTILGGTPFIESLAGGDSLYPTSLLLLVMDTHRALGWKLILHVLVAGLGGFAWLKSLGLSRSAALMGGAAFLLAPWMVTLTFPGHDGKLFVTALTPLLFLNVRSLLFRPRMRNIVGTAAIIAVVIFSTHFQAAYFLFGAAGAYAAFVCVWMARGGGAGEAGLRPGSDDDKRGAAGATSSGVPPAASEPIPSPRKMAVQRFGIFLGAAVWGAAISAIQLVPAVDYVTEFSRRTSTTLDAEGPEAIAYSSSWGLHPEEIVGLAIPEFVGGSLDWMLPGSAPAWVGNTYWGQNQAKLNHEYLGIVVLFLGLLAFVGPRLRAERNFLAGMGAVALLFALGTHTPVWRIFYEVFPGISLFRAPSIAILVAGFSAVTLAAIGAENVLLSSTAPPAEKRRLQRLSFIAAGCLLFLTILANSGLLLDVWLSVFRSGDPSVAARLLPAEPFISSGFFLAFVFVAGMAGLVWATANNRLTSGIVTALLVVFVTVDLYRVDRAFIQVTSATQVAEPDPNAQFLIARNSADPPFRVLDLGGNGQEVTLSAFGIELAAGHHPNDLRLYRELIGMVGGGPPENLIFSDAVRQILNVQYLLWPEVSFGPYPVDGSLPAVGETVSATALSGRPYETLFAVGGLPRARLVGRAVVLPENQAIPYILSNEFDAEGEVVLNAPSPIPLSGNVVQGSVRWIERGINRQTLEVEVDSPALLVLAENWFPAWRARVDGEDVEILRANHALRAVPLSAGQHTIEFRYSSRILQLSLITTLLALTALLTWVAVDIYRTRRNGSVSARS